MLYRCEFGARQSVPVGMDHPPTVYVREDAIVSRLDAWLAEIVSPEALAGAQAMPPDIAAQHMAVRIAMADCDVRIKRLLESIESGKFTSWLRRGSESYRRNARGLRQRSASTTRGAGCRPVRSPSGLTRSGAWFKCSSRRILRTAQPCTPSSA